MAEIGQGARPLLARPAGPVWAIAAALAALIPALWLWGFTVDDALIPIRYARHLAAGTGYRFNVGGPITDGVTPLPWPFVLVPLARAAPLAVLFRTKAMGLVAWVGSAAVWGLAVGRAPAAGWTKGVAIAVLALSVPLAAHSVSGMETAVAMSLATFASLRVERPVQGTLLAGLVASLRPEMLPWALVLATGAALVQDERRPGQIAGAAALALGPFVACAAARLAVFGHAAPLALLAKPSDLDHGVRYALAAALATLAPILAASPWAWRRAPAAARVIVMAAIAHVAAVAVAGGDWMPYARLMVPVAPSLIYAYVLTAPHAHPFATAGRALVALALGGYLLVTAAPAARHVGPERAQLAEEARPWLGGAHRVATLDVGWPSAATEADLIDLAGLTDPEIAALPGGHTSKRVDAAYLLARAPDVLLLYTDRLAVPLADWRSAHYPRVLEARLASSELVGAHFAARAFLPLGNKGAGYVVVTSVDRPTALR